MLDDKEVSLVLPKSGLVGFHTVSAFFCCGMGCYVFTQYRSAFLHMVSVFLVFTWYRRFFLSTEEIALDDKEVRLVLSRRGLNDFHTVSAFCRGVAWLVFKQYRRFFISRACMRTTRGIIRTVSAFFISRRRAYGLRGRPWGHVDVEDLNNNVFCCVGGVAISVRAQEVSTRYEYEI